MDRKFWYLSSRRADELFMSGSGSACACCLVEIMPWVCRGAFQLSSNSFLLSSVVFSLYFFHMILKPGKSHVGNEEEKLLVGLLVELFRGEHPSNGSF